MSVATVTQISTISAGGFEAATKGLRGRQPDLANVHGAWVKDMNVLIEDRNYTGL